MKPLPEGQVRREQRGGRRQNVSRLGQIKGTAGERYTIAFSFDAGNEEGIYTEARAVHEHIISLSHSPSSSASTETEFIVPVAVVPSAMTYISQHKNQRKKARARKKGKGKTKGQSDNAMSQYFGQEGDLVHPGPKFKTPEMKISVGLFYSHSVISSSSNCYSTSLLFKGAGRQQTPLSSSAPAAIETEKPYKENILAPSDSEIDNKVRAHAELGKEEYSHTVKVMTVLVNWKESALFYFLRLVQKKPSRAVSRTNDESKDPTSIALDVADYFRFPSKIVAHDVCSAVSETDGMEEMTEDLSVDKTQMSLLAFASGDIAVLNFCAALNYHGFSIGEDVEFAKETEQIATSRYKARLRQHSGLPPSSEVERDEGEESRSSPPSYTMHNRSGSVCSAPILTAVWLPSYAQIHSAPFQKRRKNQETASTYFLIAHSHGEMFIYNSKFTQEDISSLQALDERTQKRKNGDIMSKIGETQKQQQQQRESTAILSLHTDHLNEEDGKKPDISSSNAQNCSDSPPRSVSFSFSNISFSSGDSSTSTGREVRSTGRRNTDVSEKRKSYLSSQKAEDVFVQNQAKTNPVLRWRPCPLLSSKPSHNSHNASNSTWAKAERNSHKISDTAATIRSSCHLQAVALSPDGKAIAVAFYDGALHLYHFNLLQCIEGKGVSEETQNWTTDSVLLSSSNPRAEAQEADSSSGHSKKLRGDEESLSPIFLFAVFKSWFGSFLAVSWSLDGKYIIAGGEDECLYLYRAQKPLCLLAISEGQHSAWIRCLAFRSTQKDRKNHSGEPTYEFASGGEDGILCLWEFRDPGEPGTSADYSKAPDTHQSMGIKVFPSPSAQQIDRLSAGSGRSLRLISRQKLCDSAISDIAFEQDYILLTTNDGELRIWTKDSH